MKRPLMVLGLLSALLAAAAHGKTYVVVPARPSPTEVFAGTELQRYVGRILGEKPDLFLDLPAWGDPETYDGTAFLVGRTRFAGPLAAAALE